MNERILELAKEHLRHEMYAAYGEIIEGDYYEFDPEELQKFAELIVRECALLCSDPVVVLQHWGLDSDAKSVL
jgi:hypothetical protein